MNKRLENALEIGLKALFVLLALGIISIGVYVAIKQGEINQQNF